MNPQLIDKRIKKFLTSDNVNNVTSPWNMVEYYLSFLQSSPAFMKAYSKSVFTGCTFTRFTHELLIKKVTAE